MAMKHRAGFTLVELMVALIAGSFAVAGVYYLNGMSSRMFGEQMRVSETQMSLRSAMELIRRDFVRAGYLFTPSTTVNPNCDGATSATGVGDVSPRWLQAVTVTADGSLGDEDVSTLLGTPTTNKTRADRVVTTGNFASSDAYLSDPTRSSSTKIFLQITSESFRRSFYSPAPGNGTATFLPQAFKDAFRKGRMVRVEHEGRVFFRDILASDVGDDPTISPPWVEFESANPLPWCFDPTRWTAITPIVQYQYALEASPKPGDDAHEFARLAATSSGLGARRTLLVRRELDGAGTAFASTSRVLLDYAVEFSVDAVVNKNFATPTQTPEWEYRRGIDLGTATNPAESLRSLIVTLSSRSAEADPNLPMLDRAVFAASGKFNSPLMTFRVIDPDKPAIKLNARVRTIRSEIFLQNL